MKRILNPTLETISIEEVSQISKDLKPLFIGIGGFYKGYATKVKDNLWMKTTLPQERENLATPLLFSTLEELLLSDYHGDIFFFDEYNEFIRWLFQEQHAYNVDSIKKAIKIEVRNDDDLKNEFANDSKRRKLIHDIYSIKKQ